MIEIASFVYCYGRIFHTIRRQSKVVAGHAGRTQDVPVATASRDPNAGQVQQQETGATTGNKLSRLEMNVIKTMMVIVVTYVILRTLPTIANFFTIFGVSICLSSERNKNRIITVNVGYLILFFLFLFRFLLLY